MRVVSRIALLVVALAGCRLQDPDPEIAAFKNLLVDGSWNRYSEVYYPGTGRPIDFLSMGLVVHDRDQLTQSWAVREPDVVEFTTLRNEVRRYRWFRPQRILAYCRVGFAKPFLMAPDSLDYDRVLEAAREAGVANCNAPAVLSIAGAGVERLSDSSQTPVALKLGDLELSWQTKMAIRNLRSVQSLDFSCSRVTDSELDYVLRLSHVKEIDLSNTAVTDEGLARLQRMRSLEWIRIGGTSITPAGLGKLNEERPQLAVDTTQTAC